jgi:hypothetical protein
MSPSFFEDVRPRFLYRFYDTTDCGGAGRDMQLNLTTSPVAFMF